MTDAALRAALSRDCLAASVAIGLVIEGLRQRIEPSALADTEYADLHRAFAANHRAAARLARVAAVLRQGGKP
jgi:NAD(P)-dependent dehydrogenase (short-subunit alcohol dehydrogenase family)